MSAPNSYLPSFSSTFNGALSYASDFYQGTKSFSYEIGKEALRQSVTLAPAALIGVGQTILNGATSLNLTDSFGCALGACQVIQGTYDLLSTPIQALRGRATLFSSESLKDMSYSTLKIILGTATLFAPSKIYLDEMTNAQLFLWSTLIINSLVTAGYLAKESYSNLQKSHLLEKVSPFSQSQQSVDWEKVAKSISSAVLGTLSAVGAYQKAEVALGQRISSWVSAPADISKLKKHLKGVEPEKIQAFLAVNTKKCNYSRRDSNEQFILLGNPDLWECSSEHQKIRDELLKYRPDILAQIYRLSEKNYRENSLQDFLNKAEKYGANLNSISDLEIQKFIQMFSCYDSYYLGKIFSHHRPITHFDTTRCYSDKEFSLLNDKGLLAWVGKGKNKNPAAFFQAEYDWNGALNYHSYDRGYEYGAIEFAKDHKNLYSGTLNSATHMCEQFAEARKALGMKLKEVYINAHGSPRGMLFSEQGSQRLGFYVDTPLPQGCFEDNVAEDATIFLQSCSTASDEGIYSFFENIAGRISKFVPKGKVVGSKAPTYASKVEYKINESGNSFVHLGPETTIRKDGDTFSIFKFLFG